MAAVSGLTGRLQIHDGATFQTLGQEQSTSYSLDIERADATNKDSNNWSEGIQTIRSVSVESSGVLDETDTAYNDLEDHYFNNTKPLVRIVTPGGTTYTFNATLTSIGNEAPHDGVLSFSTSLQSSGTVTRA